MEWYPPGGREGAARHLLPAILNLCNGGQNVYSFRAEPPERGTQWLSRAEGRKGKQPAFIRTYYKTEPELGPLKAHTKLTAEYPPLS